MKFAKYCAVALLFCGVFCMPSQPSKAEPATLGIIGTSLGAAALGMHAYNYLRGGRFATPMTSYPVMPMMGSGGCGCSMNLGCGSCPDNAPKMNNCAPVYPEPAPSIPVYAAPQPSVQITPIYIPYPQYISQPMMMPAMPQIPAPVLMAPPMRPMVQQNIPVAGMW